MSESRRVFNVRRNSSSVQTERYVSVQRIQILLVNFEHSWDWSEWLPSGFCIASFPVRKIRKRGHETFYENVSRSSNLLEFPRYSKANIVELSKQLSFLIYCSIDTQRYHWIIFWLFCSDFRNISKYFKRSRFEITIIIQSHTCRNIC